MKTIAYLSLVMALGSAFASASSSSRCTYCVRDSRGRIKRSKAAIEDFKKQYPCPSTHRSEGPCPGYVIDHVKPLKEGGPDDPSNMQWQTESEAKAKDKVE